MQVVGGVVDLGDDAGFVAGGEAAFEGGGPLAFDGDGVQGLGVAGEGGAGVFVVLAPGEGAGGGEEEGDGGVEGAVVVLGVVGPVAEAVLDEGGAALGRGLAREDEFGGVAEVGDVDGDGVGDGGGWGDGVGTAREPCGGQNSKRRWASHAVSVPGLPSRPDGIRELMMLRQP